MENIHIIAICIYLGIGAFLSGLYEGTHNDPVSVAGFWQTVFGWPLIIVSLIGAIIGTIIRSAFVRDKG